MPYWRLSSFYFAALGVLIPFWGLYLKNRGFTPLAIGELMAVLTATKIVAPNLWGWIADRTGARLSMVRLASLSALLTFSGIFAVDGFWGIALVMALFGFFWNASLSQIEAVTFNHLGSRARHYATIRLWGSIGFIIVVAALGAAVEWTGTQIVPELVLVLYAGIWLSSLTIPDPGRPPVEQPSSSLSGLLRQPEIAAFLDTAGQLGPGRIALAVDRRLPRQPAASVLRPDPACGNLRRLSCRRDPSRASLFQRPYPGARTGPLQ